MSDLVTYLKYAPKHKWYVVRCGPKIGPKKVTYPKEIGQRAQNMLTILGSMINITQGTFMTI